MSNNIRNIRNVSSEINTKKSNEPYFATANMVTEVITDYDTFPYPRWYRGVPTSDIPIVAEREAGWRKRNDDCYKISCPKCINPTKYPQHCFETACSTVFPCYPKYLHKFSDRNAFNLALNDACVIQDR